MIWGHRGGTSIPGRVVQLPARLTGLLLVLLIAACGSSGAHPSAGAQPSGGLPASSGPRAGAGSTFETARVQAPSDSGPGPSASAPAPPASPAAALAGTGSFVPERLQLPSGRSAPVLAAPTRDDGSLAVPDDPATVGWWPGGSRPGDPYGTTVLAGHIDSRAYGIGVLAELVQVRPGATVTVMGAGQEQRTYRIVSVARVPKADLVPGTDAFDRTGSPRLILITCGGRFDAATHHYADNVIVTAVSTT